MLLLGLGAFALLQLWYLHKSLILADPTLVCPLAFCFYNVSTIFNSLFYYDQFSLLPTTNLLLVLLGTVVLLGGVWSVSVKTGDRQGIDVGTYHESEETAEMTLMEGETEGRVPLFRNSQSLPSRLPSDLVRTRARNVSAPIRPPLRIIDEEAVDVGSNEEQALGESLTYSKPSTSHRRRRSTLMSPTSTRQQLQAQSLLPTGGLSIGLSPISPGFAVIPKKTLRMRMPDVVRQLRMRRTVSDGDVRRGELLSDSSTEPRAPSDLESQQLISEPESANSGDKRANVRWKWLKDIVRRDSEDE